jgi:ribosomal protein S18 acetylase RimI-like enzyme
MPEILIRRLTNHDYEFMVLVWKKAGLPFQPNGRESREAFVKQLCDDHILALGAFAGGKMIGVVIGSHDGRKGWINRLAVLPGMQKQGIAQELIKKIEHFFVSKGILMFAALINSDNLASINLFIKMGYEMKSHIKYFRKLTDKEF